MSTIDSKVSVVVADDHPIFLEGLVRGLSLSGVITVAGEASSGRAALEVIRREKPRVAVIDYRMPEVDGIAVTRAVKRDKLPTRVLIISATSESALVFKALQVGAAGYMNKTSSRSEIVNAVMKIAKGGTVVPEALIDGLADEIRIRSVSQEPILSERESQVLRAFSRGLSIPDTAAELVLGASTVKTHTKRLYEKLSVSDRAAAVAEAMRRGLLE